MLIFMLKWDIWKRRNLYVFEGELRTVNDMWISFCYHSRVHFDILSKSDSIVKKTKGLKQLLLKTIDVLKP